MKSYILLACFIALGVVLGYAFIGLPNVELVTATVFLCGFVMGVKHGILGGLVTEIIYGVFNPLGAAAPPLLAGMVFSMAVTGGVGGLAGRFVKWKGWWFHASLAALGFLCTLIFAMLTSLGYALSANIPINRIWITMVSGVHFYLIQLGVNTVIFFTLVPLLIQWIQKQKRILPVMTGLFLLFIIPGSTPGQIRSGSIEISQAPEVNYRHLGDLVKTMPGIWYRDLGYQGNWAGLKISGAGLNQSEIYLNGFLIQDPVTGMSDLRTIPVEMIESISLYPVSSNAPPLSLGGALLITSRDNPLPHPYTKAVYRTGTNKWSDLDITFGQKFSKNLKIISGVLLNNEGEGSGFGHHAQQIRSDIQWHPVNRLRISYLILNNVFKSDYTYPVSVPLDTVTISFPNCKNEQMDHMLRTTFYSGQCPVQLSWQYTKTKYRLRDRYSTVADTLRGHRNRLSMEQQIPVTTLPWIWRIQVQKQSLSADTVEANRLEWEALAHTPLTLFRNWKLDTQIGWHQGTEPLLFGRERLFYQPDTNLAVWSGVHRCYREPTLGEEAGLYFLPTLPEYNDHWTLFHFADNLTSNPALHSETAWIWDLGFKVQLPGFQIFLRGFYQQSEQLIQLHPTDDLIQFNNQGKQQYYGCETQAVYSLWPSLMTSVTCNYIYDVETDGLFERPNFWGSAQLIWQHPFFQNDLDLKIVLQTQFWSDFYSLYGYNLDNIQTLYHRSNGLLHGKISGRIMDNAVIALSMDNILDTPVSSTGDTFLQSRTFRVSYYWELFD